MDKNQQVAMTASAAVAAIASGRIDAATYIETLLDRAEALSGLRALICIDREGAMTAARAVDAARNEGRQLPPLAGLPIVVKDNIDMLGWPTTGGTPALADVFPPADAPVLAALLRAGAIVLGKANMHELAFGTTNTNFTPFAGVARNPYDTGRIVGGSSGGSASAIAARLAPAGLGTDTGGSVRVPAALNGIAGLRPSVGNGGAERRDTGAGTLPLSRTRDTIGPMARTVADVALLDSAITGARLPKPSNLDGLRLGMPSVYWDVVDVQTRGVMSEVRVTLEAAGVTFVPCELPSIRELGEKTGFPLVFHEAGEDIRAYLDANGASHISLEEIARQIASPDVKDAFAGVLSGVIVDDYANALNVYRPQMRACFEACFADNELDAIWFPTTPMPAVPIDFENGSSSVSLDGGPAMNEFATLIRNCDLGSIVGLPGLTIPAGLTEGGLPVGLALDGAVGSDSKLLAIGLAIETLVGPLPAPEIQ